MEWTTLGAQRPHRALALATDLSEEMLNNALTENRSALVSLAEEKAATAEGNGNPTALEGATSRLQAQRLSCNTQGKPATPHG